MFRAFPKTFKRLCWSFYKAKKWFETHPTLIVRFALISLTVTSTVLKLQNTSRGYEIDVVRKQLYRVIRSVESANGDLDKINIAVWKKRVFDDGDGVPVMVMIYMNKTYQVNFMEAGGLSPFDYIGKTDIEFWGTELGTEYLKEDIEVYRTGEDLYAVGNSPVSGKLLIVKWRTLENGVYYVWGMAFNKKEAKKWFNINIEK